MNRINEYCLKNNTTKDELSKTTKISAAHISEVSNGKKKITVEKAIRIAKALKTTVEELFGEQEMK